MLDEGPLGPTSAGERHLLPVRQHGQAFQDEQSTGQLTQALERVHRYTATVLVGRWTQPLFSVGPRGGRAARGCNCSCLGCVQEEGEEGEEEEEEGGGGGRRRRGGGGGGGGRRREEGGRTYEMCVAAASAVSGQWQCSALLCEVTAAATTA